MAEAAAGSHMFASMGHDSPPTPYLPQEVRMLVAHCSSAKQSPRYLTYAAMRQSRALVRALDVACLEAAAAGAEAEAAAEGVALTAEMLNLAL